VKVNDLRENVRKEEASTLYTIVKEEAVKES
jgi:hypothetical protein